MPTKTFELGRVVATPGALDLIESNGLDLRALLARHESGDWGGVDAEDKRANQEALNDGSRLLSAYGEDEQKIWIITDAATDACPACTAGIGVCEPGKGTHEGGFHFRTDLPPRRLTTTVLRPEDY